MPFGALQNFISTIQPGRINSFGFYGGEPSIHPLEFDWVMSMVEPYAKPLFVITNGAWSMDTARTKAFLRWMGRRNAQVFVSGTPFHQRHQNQAVLDAIINDPFYGGLFNLKSGETDFHLPDLRWGLPRRRKGQRDLLCHCSTCRSHAELRVR
jgi:hypothetical protein